MKINVDQLLINEYVDNVVKEGKVKINVVKIFSEYKKDVLVKIVDVYNVKVNEVDNFNVLILSEIVEVK